jgi:hypothetical protein
LAGFRAELHCCAATGAGKLLSSGGWRHGSWDAPSRESLFFDASTVQQKEVFLNGKDDPVAMTACDAAIKSVPAMSESDDGDGAYETIGEISPLKSDTTGP